MIYEISTQGAIISASSILPCASPNGPWKELINLTFTWYKYLSPEVLVSLYLRIFFGLVFSLDESGPATLPCT